MSDNDDTKSDDGIFALLDPDDPVIGRKAFDEILDKFDATLLPHHTVTSSAYMSAELFNPDQAPIIKAYQEALKRIDKADVFALSTGKIAPESTGIMTNLSPEVIQTYAEFEFSEQQTQETRQHDFNVEDVKTSGSMSVEILKGLLYISSTLILTFLGFKVFG